MAQYTFQIWRPERETSSDRKHNSPRGTFISSLAAERRWCAFGLFMDGGDELSSCIHCDEMLVTLSGQRWRRRQRQRRRVDTTTATDVGHEAWWWLSLRDYCWRRIHQFTCARIRDTTRYHRIVVLRKWNRSRVMYGTRWVGRSSVRSVVVVSFVECV